MKPLPFKMICETDVERYRAESFFDKEPETTAWINSLGKSDILIDVGANVGIYTLYAAPKVRYVYAIEPVLSNFSRLVENIEINGFHNVSCLNFAIGDRCGIQKLYIPSNLVGSSGAQLKNPVDEQGNTFHPAKETNVLQVPLLLFISIANINTFSRSLNIKIDIDGQEELLIEDLLRIRPKSFLLEYNGDDIESLKKLIKENDYKEDFADIPNHSRIRREREGIKAQNLIFRRDDEL